MQNDDEALHSISPPSLGQMLITLDPHGIF